MDLIKMAEDARKAELTGRLEKFDTTILVMSHEGDVDEAGGYSVLRARTLKEFAHAEVGVIYAFDADDVRLVEVIVAAQDVLGFKISSVESFPGQKSSEVISSVMAELPRVDFLRLMGDIADQRLINESMTESEREASLAKKQHHQRANKRGEVKALVDFDRSFKDEDDAIAPEGV